MNDAEVLRLVDTMQNTMTAVSTGGPRIQDVEGEYREQHQRLQNELSARAMTNPLPPSLWEWHGRWSRGDMPQYHLRRTYVRELFQPLRERLSTVAVSVPEPTGWERVDRAVLHLNQRLHQASNEEQFQAVGLLCREVTISLGQAVFDPWRHTTLDGVEASQTDAKRMLEAYIAAELAGDANEYMRAVVRATFNLANNVQHKRTAALQAAALCVEATNALVRLLAIVAGRRQQVS